jgi:Fe2+ or Zn2+ uptake regulation protein
MDKEKSQEIREILQSSGIHPTAQRIAILSFISGESNHSTAEEVKDWVDGNFPNISLATVYNTLNVLVQVGLVQEFKLPHTTKVIYDWNTSPHHHFLDESTGELLDIPQSLVLVHPDVENDFIIHDVQAMIRGTKRTAEK